MSLTVSYKRDIFLWTIVSSNRLNLIRICIWRHSMALINNTNLHISLIPLLYIIRWTTHYICITCCTNSFCGIKRSWRHSVFLTLLLFHFLRMLISLDEFDLFLRSFSKLNSLLITQINLLMLLFLGNTMRIWRL